MKKTKNFKIIKKFPKNNKKLEKKPNKLKNSQNECKKIPILT
jgi:hypothetical protein